MTSAAMQRTRIHLHLLGYECVIHSLEGEEALNAPGWFKVTTPDELPFELDELLNQAVTLTLTGPGGHLRRIPLQIQAVEEDWPDGRPWLTFTLGHKLNQGRDQFHSRLFMDQSRDTVLKQLLTEMGYAPDEIDLRLDSVPAHEGPFLQARESNLHCFHRLLADVGANYWFESPETDGTHPSERLVISNDTQISPYLPHIEWAQAVSGLAPDEQLNRITAAYRRWRLQPATVGHAVVDSQAGALSNDSAQHQQFEPPRPRNEAEQRALFEQQYLDQHRFTLELHSHQPLLAAGHTLALDAHQLPVNIAGNFRILKVRHQAAPTGTDSPVSGGVQYRNIAETLPRATAVRPEPASPPDLPQIFPARIESRYDRAELGADGRYYFRYDFDTTSQPLAQASALTERLAPYGSPVDPKKGHAVGWHFPLLNRATVMVSCLNNDPARPLILGFVPSRRQLGPVTKKNATQSRLVTPSQHELLFDDAREAERIALHTFDRQLCLELNAQSAEPYCQVLAQFGGVRLRAKKDLHLETQNGNAEERIGNHRSQTVKQNSATTTEEGAVYHQANTDHIHLAQVQFTQSAGNDYSLWVQKKGLNVTSATGIDTVVDAGDYQILIADGAMIQQVAGDITIQGDGGGDITLIKGEAGIRMDPSGNIKLFGKKITLKGQSGVVFNGEVQYEAGAGNEPEKAAALEAYEIPQLSELDLLAFQATEQEYRERPEQENEPIPLTVQVRTALGNPVADVELKLETENGTIQQATSNEEGKAEFTALEPSDRGCITYLDEEDFLHKSISADLSGALRQRRLRTLCQLLQAAVDYQAVSAVYPGDLAQDIQDTFSTEDDQDILFPLMAVAGLIGMDDMEVQSDA